MILKQKLNHSRNGTFLFLLLLLAVLCLIRFGFLKSHVTVLFIVSDVICWIPNGFIISENQCTTCMRTKLRPSHSGTKKSTTCCCVRVLSRSFLVLYLLLFSAINSGALFETCVNVFWRLNGSLRILVVILVVNTKSCGYLACVCNSVNYLISLLFLL